MKTKQRFEKMVEKATCSDPGIGNGLLLGAEDIVTLLLREHRRTLRKVRRQLAVLNPTIAVEDWGKGYRQACDDLLAAMKGQP